MTTHTRKSSKTELIFALVGSLLALVAGITTVFFGSARLFDRSNRIASTDAQFIERLQAFGNALSDQEALVNSVSSRVNAIIKPPSPESQLAIQISAMRADLDGLDKRLKTIEEAVVDTPSKALSVPLLRQELETLKLNSQKDVEAQAKQIDRIYDQNKWFIGLMFTMAIGLIGLAISNFLQARKSESG